MIEIPILYEDEFLLAVNKPSGVSVNRSENEKGDTVQDWVEQTSGIMLTDNQECDFINRSGVIHRLDKETSGILLIAKNEKIFLQMQLQFQERIVSKTYVALVHGHISESRQIIKVPVGRLPWSKRKFGVIPDGRPAETEIEKTAEYSLNKDKFTLIKAYPKTGRTHQIRIHLKYINHPVVADPLYAGRKILRDDHKYFRRLFLHARGISFMHPGKNKQINLKCDLPDELLGPLKAFDKS